MSLQAKPRSRVPAETARVARAALPKGNPYLTLRDALATIYPDSLFATLFPTRGQPAAAPGQLAVVTVLQFAEGWSDRQAAEAVRSRMDWKYLLGLTLADPGFDFSILREFRERLIEGGQAQRLLDALWERFRRRGWVKARGKQRTDSTHVPAAVRSLNRVECVGETLRQALHRLAGMAPHWLQAHVPSAWYERYGRRLAAARFPKTERAREHLALQIGQDGLQVLPGVYAPATPVELQQHPTSEILRQVWVQQYYRHDHAISGRTTDNMPPTAHSIHAPYAPEARYSQKRQTEWIGYTVHRTETCDEERPRLSTHVETTPATTQDEPMTDTIHTALAANDLLPKEH